MPDDVSVPAEEMDLPAYKIEMARSGRSKCKTCRRPIQKEKLRIGVLIQGPFGPGYLWHHLTCAARRRLEDVEAAYAALAWPEGLELPTLESLQKLVEEGERKKAEKPKAPYAERAPTGRSKCKHCGEMIEQNSFRVALLRNVEFYGKVRSGPINVHPGCVAAELRADDCATEAEAFQDELRANSKGAGGAELDDLIRQIGPLSEG
ncbi:MAG: hypothetical protein V2A76_03200 [Planctomycetota bacterium]